LRKQSKSRYRGKQEKTVVASWWTKYGRLAPAEESVPVAGRIAGRKKGAARFGRGDVNAVADLGEGYYRRILERMQRKN
jgi:hypothetical protein